MPPRKLTADEQAFVDRWVPKMFYFMKMMRRANRFIVTIPREEYMTAYKEVSNSGFVAGGEWGSQRNPNDKRSWEPKPGDREDYVKHMEGVIERHPITSAINATTVFFAGNGGSMCVSKTIVMGQPQRVHDEFWKEVHKLNNEDLAELRSEAGNGPRPVASHDIDRDFDERESSIEDLAELRSEAGNNPHPVASHDFDRDPDERPIDMPFVRARPVPDIKISESNWPEYEAIGQTYFVEDEDDDTGYTTFELAGILQLKSGKYYKICYEDNVDSIQIPESDLFSMIEDGMWV